MTRRAHLRYDGTDTAVPVELTDPGTMVGAFETGYRTTYSFLMDRPIIAESVSVEASGLTEQPDLGPLGPLGTPSFPSGHSTAAAATYAALALVLGRDRTPRARSVLAGIAVGIAVAVAGSRVLLGVHWFSDVVAGLALGWTWFALCAVAFGGRVLWFGAPAVAASTPAPSHDSVGSTR